MGTQTTIKNIEGREYQGKMNYTVTLADGTTGYLQKESDTGLQNGDTVFAMVEDYTSKAGNKSKLITLKKLDSAVATPTSTPTPTPTGGQSSSLYAAPVPGTKQMKFEGLMECIKLAHGAYTGGKLDDKAAQDHCRQWVVMSDALIDDLIRR